MDLSVIKVSHGGSTGPKNLSRIPWWPHRYTAVITVSRGGSTGTLVSFEHLLVTPVVPLFHQNISWWFHWYTCVIRVSIGGSTDTLVSLQYHLLPPLVW